MSKVICYSGNSEEVLEGEILFQSSYELHFKGSIPWYVCEPDLVVLEIEGEQYLSFYEGIKKRKGKFCHVFTWSRYIA